jgi:hypothetical protein
MDLMIYNNLSKIIIKSQIIIQNIVMIQNIFPKKVNQNKNIIKLKEI